ncbi:hypothetical protein P8452_03032 [Trifolium repens]|nr:hypothetical protein P8452_03032 [Trifolium repens]
MIKYKALSTPLLLTTTHPLHRQRKSHGFLLLRFPSTNPRRQPSTTSRRSYVLLEIQIQAGVFLAMLIQLMNATKELKRISQKLSNFDFGARIGLWLLFLQCVRDWLILLYNGF